MAGLNPLDMLKQVVSPGSTAGVLRDRNAANAAAANGTDTGVVAPAPAIPAGAPMTAGVASPMELAVRAKLKAVQDARLQQLLKARGVGATPDVAAPVVGGANPADLIQ